MSVYVVDVILLVVTVVIAGALLALRSRLTAPSWRDFIGITAAFVVLAFLTFQMIVAEYALG